MGAPQDKGFMIRVVAENPTDNEDTKVAIFVAEHAATEEQIEQLQEGAARCGWQANITREPVALVGGDGCGSVAEWLASLDYAQTTNDPHASRMNHIEREVSSLKKNVKAGFASIAAALDDTRRMFAEVAGIVKAAQSSPKIDPEVQRTAYVAGARMPPEFDAPGESKTLADQPVAGRRRDRPMVTREMAGNPDFASQSMATVGAGAGSTIFTNAAGVDEEGLPVALSPARRPRVGTTLHRGTPLTDE